MERIYNFSAGPATLPVEVLETARDELLKLARQRHVGHGNGRIAARNT